MGKEREKEVILFISFEKYFGIYYEKKVKSKVKAKVSNGHIDDELSIFHTTKRNKQMK